MTTLSSLIGKPVLNIATSCIIGEVADVYFDKNLKNAVYFCIAATADKAFVTPASSNKFLLFSDAQNISDALVIADDTKLLSANDVDLTALRKEVMGTSVYTPTGVSKGDLSDIIIGAAGKVTKFQTVSDEFAPSAIMSIGDVILQKNNAKNKSRKPSIPRPKKDYPVYILSDAAKALEVEKNILNKKATVPTKNKNTDAASAVVISEPLNDASAATQVKPAVALGDSREPVLSNGAFNVLLDGSQAYSYDEDAHTPTRIICDYEFLLGRTLGADLCTYTGELIAKQGSAVTDLVVEKARRAGKLVELTLNSIKPDKQNRN